MVTKYQQDIAVVNESSVLPGNGWTWDDINPEARQYVMVYPFHQSFWTNVTRKPLVVHWDGLREPVICWSPGKDRIRIKCCFSMILISLTKMGGCSCCVVLSYCLLHPRELTAGTQTLVVCRCFSFPRALLFRFHFSFQGCKFDIEGVKTRGKNKGCSKPTHKIQQKYFETT